MNKNKEKIQEALDKIDKKFGVGTVQRYGDKTKVKAEVISTGIPSLDKALGVYGFPKGKIIEIYGPESSGKTTLSLTVMAECQKSGGTVAFIDAEHALDPIYAEALGVVMDDVLLSQPDSGEQALEVTETLVRSEGVDLVVIDSVAALTPRAEINGEMGDSLPGLQARLMSQALRKLTGIAAKNGCTIIFINQLREKIGVMFGSPETTTGGKALKFYASIRIDIRRKTPIKDGDKVIGNETVIKVVKNKLAPPFKETKVDILYGEGISKESDLIEMAVNEGILEKSGAWFRYEGSNFAQGKEKARQHLKDNPEFFQKINKELIKKGS